MTNTALQKRVNIALNNDNSILVHRKDVLKSRPFSVEYLESLGLRKGDLKKLESAGLAIRGLARFGKNLSKIGWLLITDTEMETENEAKEI